MAWIKMRTDLSTDPAVIRMASALDVDDDLVVGKLHRLWSWADAHTTDGIAVGVSERWVDKYVGRSGFAAAMVQIGWLVIEPERIVFPRFDKHNGESAKKRDSNTMRQRLSRQERDNGVTGTGRTAVPVSFKRHVMERDKYKCVYCGTASNVTSENAGGRWAKLTADHLVPANRGGRSSVDNLVTACRRCNSEKNDRTPEEWGVLPTRLARGVEYRDGGIIESLTTRDNGATEARPEQRSREQTENKTMLKSNALPEFNLGDDACSLLRTVGMDEGGIRFLLGKPGVDDGQVHWACERLRDEITKARRGKRKPIANPAGYVRQLIETKRPPQGWRDEWNRKRLAEQASRVGGLKIAGG